MDDATPGDDASVIVGRGERLGSAYPVRRKNSPRDSTQQEINPTLAAFYDGASEACGDPELLTRELKKTRKALTYCYEKELRTSQTLAGAYSLTLAIELDGSVKTVEDASEPPKALEQVHACTVRIAKRIRFGALNVSGCAVTYTFSFAPAI